MTMADRKDTAKSERTYTISLANRKARGSGHEHFGEILAAAKEIFLEQGVENVTTRRIAERVGISQTALFSYYKTKDDIFAQLIRDAFQELAVEMAEVDRTATDTRDRFRLRIAHYIAFWLDYPDEYRLAFMVVNSNRNPAKLEPVASPGEGYRADIQLFLQLEKRVGDAIAEGVIRRDLGSRCWWHRRFGHPSTVSSPSSLPAKKRMFRGKTYRT
jgi:AcrR family transcriptional regulator